MQTPAEFTLWSEATAIGDDLLIAFVLSESAAQRLIIHRWSSISFHYAIMLNADWVGPMGKRTIWTFEWSPRSCVGPKGVFACLLNPLYSHSARWHMERNWGNHHLNASLHAADSLSNDDCKSWTLVVPATQNSSEEHQCFSLKDLKEFQVAKKNLVLKYFFKLFKPV